MPSGHRCCDAALVGGHAAPTTVDGAAMQPSSSVAGAAMQPSSSVAGCCDATLAGVATVGVGAATTQRLLRWWGRHGDMYCNGGLRTTATAQDSGSQNCFATRRLLQPPPAAVCTAWSGMGVLLFSSNKGAATLLLAATEMSAVNKRQGARRAAMCYFCIREEKATMR